MGETGKVWNLHGFLNGETNKKFALIQLNTPLVESDVEGFKHLWKNSVIRACVDGAANILYNCDHLQRERYIPDIISGDFDSITKDVSEFYKQKGSQLINTPDQNYTDFTKCLKLVSERISSNNLEVDCIIAHFALNGRFDHIMGNLETMYHCHELTSLPLFLHTMDSITFLLKQGKHTLMLPEVFSGNVCGLIPLGAPCKSVSTTGLRWNLNKQELAFGKLVSTSNLLEMPDGKVTIETDETLVWTMTVPIIK